MAELERADEDERRRHAQEEADVATAGERGRDEVQRVRRAIVERRSLHIEEAEALKEQIGTRGGRCEAPEGNRQRSGPDAVAAISLSPSRLRGKADNGAWRTRSVVVLHGLLEREEMEPQRALPAVASRIDIGHRFSRPGRPVVVLGRDVVGLTTMVDGWLQ